MKAYQIHSPDSFKSMPWRNGLGHTIELLSEHLPQSDDFGWRVSMADVVSDGRFSDFSGYDRTLLLLKGQGMTLTYDNNTADELVEKLQAANFKGEDETHAILHDGPIKDFNVMAKRDYCSATVNSFKNAIDNEITIDGDILLIYAFEDTISIESESLEKLTLESNHLFQVKNPSEGKCKISGTAFIVIQIHYKDRNSRV